MIPALVLDTETTDLVTNGLLALEHRPQIVEFYSALIMLDDEHMPPIETHAMFKPTRPMQPDASKVTGISDEDLKDFAPFEDFAPRIRTVIEAAPLVICHGLAFDREVIDIEFERLGQKLKWPKRLICTVESTVHLKGYRLTLQGMHEYLFGETFKDAHRAKADTEALIRCARELYRRMQI